MIRLFFRYLALHAGGMLALACTAPMAAAAGTGGGKAGHGISVPDIPTRQTPVTQPATQPPIQPPTQQTTQAATQPATATDSDTGGIFSGYNAAYDDYEAFKNRLETDDHLTFSLLTSYYFQSATPNGGQPVSLFVYAPTVSWTPFTIDTWGSGQINISFIQNQYWSAANNGSQQARIGVITTPNDWTSNGYNWSQVSYTHTLPGALSWLSITAGQFSIGSFDGNLYAGDPQNNFITYALAQNATQTYPDAGLGGYLGIAIPDTSLTVSAGFQNAANTNGQSITTNGFQTGKYAWFGNALWVPDVTGLGKGSYSILVYTQPSVPMQPGQSTGVSLSVSQDLGPAFSLVGRANYASGSVSEIASSFGAGGVFHDPFHHAESDQLGVGWLLDRVNNNALEEPSLRHWEYGPEVYYRYALLKGLDLTPDAAAIINPVLAPNHGVAYIFTLRLTSHL